MDGPQGAAVRQTAFLSCDVSDGEFDAKHWTTPTPPNRLQNQRNTLARS